MCGGDLSPPGLEANQVTRSRAAQLGPDESAEPLQLHVIINPCCTLLRFGSACYAALLEQWLTITLIPEGSWGF